MAHTKKAGICKPIKYINTRRGLRTPSWSVCFLCLGIVYFWDSTSICTFWLYVHMMLAVIFPNCCYTVSYSYYIFTPAAYILLPECVPSHFYWSFFCSLGCCIGVFMGIIHFCLWAVFFVGVIFIFYYWNFVFNYIHTSDLFINVP